jgi:hypothetical protein
MSFLDTVWGETKKLKFEAYSDNKFEKKVSDFTVQYNPGTFANSFQISREDRVTGETTTPIYKFITLPDVSIDFTLDASGVDANVLDLFKTKTIKEQIDTYLKVVYDVNSTSHEPNFVKIIYGELIYKTVLKSCDITYTLFKADGTPLRAKVASKFQSIQNSKELARTLSLESPDVTHQRIMKDHDNLVSLSNETYERNDLYQEVARFNDLNTFRRVPAGTNLFFPSVKK